MITFSATIERATVDEKGKYGMKMNERGRELIAAG